MIERLTSAAPAAALFDEYLRWLTSRFESEYGVVLDAAAVARYAAKTADFLGPGGRLLGARLSGELVGLGALESGAAPGTAEVKRMWVRPDARGFGLARALLEALIDAAREQGYRRLRLETVTFMHPAMALYRSVGFAEAEPFDGECAAAGLGAVTICMTMELEQASGGSLDMKVASPGH